MAVVRENEASPAIAHFLSAIGDVRKDPSGDETPAVDTRPVRFVLAFSNLTYSVTSTRKIDLLRPFRRRRIRLGAANDEETAGMESWRRKTLLNGISGEARDGEILAVLGASGSGKSTLIDALANRIVKESLKGVVTLNGEPLGSNLLKSISAYVMQDDLLFPMLTVEETLMFAAEFRLPRSLSKSKKKTRVRGLIQQLGLQNAANTVIGDEGHRGISGGERRRVSIGADMIHDPIILFLDEPTSGLDSTSAFMVVKVLQRIAESGSIVIMSLHQPSYRILTLLNRLIILSRGNTVYIGNPHELPPFFSDFGHRIPENENRIEFVLDLIQDLEGSTGGIRSLIEFNKSRTKINHTCNETIQRGLKDAIAASVSRGKLVSGASKKTTADIPTFANPFWIEVKILAERSVKNSRRMPEIFGIRLAAVLVTGFMLATMFWSLDDSPKGVQERFGFFAFAMSTTFYTCADALPVFIQERYIFMRETSYNAYRRLSYVLSHAIVSFPALIFLSSAFACTTFWTVGLSGGLSGFVFYLCIILSSFWAGNSIVTFISGVLSNVMLGYTVVFAILAYFLLFSGFFVNRERIPDYWIWFHYLSLVKYPYEAVLRNEFSDRSRCFVRGLQMFDETPMSGASETMKMNLLQNLSRSLGINITRSTCVLTGSDVLEQQGITQLSKWDCVWITIAWGFLFRILFYFSLLLRSKNKRR